ncbi:MAG: HdeD family acid-resistance protein [Myxococcaceae bacterium]
MTTEPKTVAQEVRSRAGWSIAAGVLLIIAGIVALSAPFIAALTVTIFVGWAMIFGGVAQAIYAFTTKDSAGHVIFKVLLAILYVVAGGYILYNPLPGVAALALLLGWVLVIEAVVLAVLAFQVRPRAGWGLWLFDAIVTLALGIFILVNWPGNSFVILAAFVGVSMILSGISRLMLGGTVRSFIPKPPAGAKA